MNSLTTLQDRVPTLSTYIRVHIGVPGKCYSHLKMPNYGLATQNSWCVRKGLTNTTKMAFISFLVGCFSCSWWARAFMPGVGNIWMHLTFTRLGWLLEIFVMDRCVIVAFTFYIFLLFRIPARIDFFTKMLSNFELLWKGWIWQIFKDKSSFLRENC